MKLINLLHLSLALTGLAVSGEMLRPDGLCHAYGEKMNGANWDVYFLSVVGARNSACLAPLSVDSKVEMNLLVETINRG